MAGVNKVILIGHLGRDPEVRAFQNGGKVCSLSIATSESWKDKQSGERKERTEWHRVSIYQEGLVRIAEQYLSKGSKIYIEGKLETRKYTDQAGVEKYATEVTLRPFNGTLVMLGGNGGKDGEGSSSSGSHGGGYGGSGGNFNNDLDDEIPFNMEWRG